jgi:hypothetical protein
LGESGLWLGSVELRFFEVPFLARLGPTELRSVVRAIFCLTAVLSMRFSSTLSFSVPEASIGIVSLRSFINLRCPTSFAFESMLPSETENDDEDEARLSDRTITSSEAQQLPEPSSEDIRLFERMIPCRNTAAFSTRSDFDGLSPLAPACIRSPDSSLGKIALRAFGNWGSAVASM